MGSPIEGLSADLLYEYFPLSLDDWYVSLSSIQVNIRKSMKKIQIRVGKEGEYRE